MFIEGFLGALTGIGVFLAMEAVVALSLGGSSLIATWFRALRPRRQPQPGDVWELNPFDTCAARVLEVRKGWVLYSVRFTALCAPMEVQDFVCMYSLRTPVAKD